jgi:hypothetical protein
VQALRDFLSSIEENIDPIWQREWKQQFNGGSFVRRIGPCLLLVLLVGIMLTSSLAVLRAPRREEIPLVFRLFSSILFVSMVLLASAWNQSSARAGWFIPEKNSKVLFFLLSTPVSSLRLILAKLIPSWWDAALGFLVPLPLLVAGIPLGAWRASEVFFLFAVTLLIEFGARLRNLKQSIHAKDMKELRWFKSFEMIFFGIGWFIFANWTNFVPLASSSLVAGMISLWDQTWFQLLVIVVISIHRFGPIIPLLSFLGVPLPMRFEPPMAMLIVSMIVRLGFSIWTLRRAAASLREVAMPQMLGEPLRRAPIRERIDAFWRSIRPGVWDDHPIVWRQMFVGKKSIVRLMTSTAITLLALFILLACWRYWQGAWQGIGQEPTLLAAHFLTGHFLFFVAMFGLWLTAQAVSEERLKETWPSILATPLSNREIIVDLLVPTMVPIASMMLIALLVVIGALTWQGISLWEMTALPFVMLTWFAWIAATGTMAIVNSAPKGRGATDVFVWSVGLLSPVLVIAILAWLVTYLWQDNLRSSDFIGLVNPIRTDAIIADAFTATGFLWYWQTEKPGEFTFRMFLGLPATLLYLWIYAWFWPRCIRRFAVVNERRDSRYARRIYRR